MLKKGRSRSQQSLNQAIDDLLGGDDGDIVSSKARFGAKNDSSLGKKNSSSSIPKKALTSNASSKDFYSSLSAIAGHDISEGNDEEDAEVDVEDAANIAKGLAGMDDLESDLFGSFTGKKVNQKAQGSSSFFDSKKKKKKPEFTDFDEDDPLAGLGLSDDEDILSKSKPKKPELAKRLSGTSKGKVDPNIATSDAQSQNSTPVRSPSFDRDDPFLATDPRPRSGSGSDRKFKRINSWDEPSIGTQSESELTPRSRSGSGEQQMRNGRRGSKKKKVNPSPPKAEIETSKDREDSHDLPDSGRVDHKQSTIVERTKSKDQTKAAKQIDDIFGDEEGLPGLSDDERSSPKKKPVKNIVEDTEPTRSAAAALDDLLGGKSKVKESKSRKPTFLEQMMSKGTTKKVASDLDAESPITSPREKSVAFGGYSPSVGGAMDRPISAPSKRSVRFADELGFDELDLSLNDSRPSTAPGSGRSRKPNRLKDASIGSSFEDENTDMSLDLSNSEFKRSSTPTSTTLDTKERFQSKNKSKDSIDTSSISTKPSSPRRSLQSSRRKHQVIGEEQQTGQEDWLGLDDPQAPRADKSVAKSSDPNSARTESDDKKVVGSGAEQVPQGDWLGLSNENVNRTLQTELQTPNEKLSNQVKDSSEENKQSTKSSIPSNDDLFPWETPGPRERPRRRNRRFEDATRESELKKDRISNVSKGDSFITHSPKGRSNDATAKHANQIDTDKPSVLEKQLQSEGQPISNDSLSVIPSAKSLDSLIAVAESTSQPSQRQNSFQRGTVSQHPQMTEQQAVISQPPFPGSNSSTASSASHLLYNQDAVMNQTFAAQRPMILNQMGVNDQNMLLSANPSLLAVTLERANTDKAMQQHRINEYEIAKTQNENALKSLEAELRTMYSKVSEMGEVKTRVELESSKRIEDLQEKVMKLEMENDHLKSSQEILKNRHENEIKAVESSHKMRFQILEETYKRRESQLKEDNDFTVQQLNERIKALEMEKSEIFTTHKERLTVVEKSKETDLERLKSLQKKAIDDLRKDYEDQLERLHMLKEQELAAATSMFSQARSLQGLIQQVQNSTTEVEQMQKRIDLSHKDNLNDREQSLRVRDEYLKSMQEKLQRQEVESTEERSRLQSLIAKLEMQLREQGRQLEQDRWKVLQDENRIKSMQDATEEERKYTLQQLNNERQMINKSRDELMNEQRRILAECYEERRRVAAEKAELEKTQNKHNRDNLDKEFAALNEREIEISQKEEKLEKEMQILEQSFKNIAEEKQKLQEFAKVVHAKSKEMESLSKEAMRVQQEGIESLEHAHAMNMEVENASAELENRAMLLDQQERELSEKIASFKVAKAQYEASKGRVRCTQCNQRTVEAPLTSVAVKFMPEDSHQAQAHDEKYLSEQLQQQQRLGSELSPAVSLNSLSIVSTTPLDDKQLVKENESRLQPPDVILGSLKFNRTLRKWSADKEQDEEFFEQEGRYLNEIQRKRAVKLASVS